MYDLDAINADQLVTATDRALRGRLEKYRAAAFLRGTNHRFSVAASFALAHAAVTGDSEEVTVYMRGRESTRPLVLMLCALAMFAWLCVGLVCLLG